MAHLQQQQQQQQSNNGEPTFVEWEVSTLYQGPSWITNYVIDVNEFYMQTRKTAPLNWSKGECTKQLKSAQCVRVEVNLLPLIEDLNKTGRNFYATAGYKKNVVNSHAAWCRQETYPSVSYRKKSELPSRSRLTSTFKVDRSKEDVFTHVFWLTKNRWKMEVDEDFVLNAQLAEQKEEERLNPRVDVDEDLVYIDHPAEEKLAHGKDFRGGSAGLRVSDWIVPASEVGDPEENHDEEREDDEFLVGIPPSSQVIHSLCQDTWEETSPEPTTEGGNLMPSDSISNPGRGYNHRADRAANGWDDETSAGKLGWSQQKVSSGNAEVGVKTDVPAPAHRADGGRGPVAGGHKEKERGRRPGEREWKRERVVEGEGGEKGEGG